MNLFTDLKYPSPLRKVEQWNVKDSSKTDTFMSCPRKYFYRYILGWTPDMNNIHLGFGTAWHLAVEHLARCHHLGLTKAHVDEANDIFLASYRKEFDAEWDEDNAPKNPAFAYLGLIAIANKLEKQNMNVLYTEIPGTISLTDDDVIHFKIDMIAEGLKGHDFHGQKFIVDWKTTKSATQSWRDQWEMAIQPKTYLHAINFLYGAENVAGVIMSGTIFRKTKPIEFMDHHVGATPTGMMMWMWTMRHHFSLLKWCHEALAASSDEDDIMEAFPPNPSACTSKWGTCPFLSVCSNTPNPLQMCGEPPVNMKIEHWDPRDREEVAPVTFEETKLVTKETTDA